MHRIFVFKINYKKEKETDTMKKFVCTVCGYVYEGETAPEVCPVCKAPASKFKEQSGEKTWAAEHVVGVAKVFRKIFWLI